MGPVSGENGLFLRGVGCFMQAPRGRSMVLPSAGKAGWLFLRVFGIFLLNVYLWQK